MSYDKNGDDDEQRLCPTCRMNVSVWATKCHHCGEEVGRPKREEKKLTLKDLGEPGHTTYVPSGNVTGALDSFRADEIAAEVSRAARKPVGFWARLLGKQQPPLEEPPKLMVEQAPELDEYSKNLAASILDDMPAMSSRSISSAQLPGQASSSVAQRLLKVGGVLVAVIILYFGGSFAWSHASAWFEARNQPPEVFYINKAPEMLARDELVIDVFEEAMKAVGINRNEENLKIADDVRVLLLKSVDDLMAKNPWKRSDHDKATSYMRRAAYVTGHPSVTAKFAEVNDDVATYRFVLKSVDATATKATFRLNNPKFEAEAIVEVGDRLMERFIIQRISSGKVELSDDRVRGRKLVIRPHEGVESGY
ncbi:MAG: hypothetical protein L3K26_04450 [Candidatus Hydrogenedentes bacterium]|nr:hypothetical protein [Candidatus Hydrogenedentota bacterium]